MNVLQAEEALRAQQENKRAGDELLVWRRCQLQKLVFNVGCALRVCVKGKWSYTSIALEKDMWQTSVA